MANEADGKEKLDKRPGTNRDQPGEDEARYPRDFLSPEKGDKERSSPKKRRWDDAGDSTAGHKSSSSSSAQPLKKSTGIAMALKADPKKDEKVLLEKKPKVASIFNNDSDLVGRSIDIGRERRVGATHLVRNACPSVCIVYQCTDPLSYMDTVSSEEEEMPLECRMKMRNIGRDTITSAGPKSFNKGKNGFNNNSFKAFEMSMKPRNNLEKKTSYEGTNPKQ